MNRPVMLVRIIGATSIGQEVFLDEHKVEW